MTLKQNYSGLAVVLLQLQLLNLEIYPAPIDGKFGPTTDTAVKLYQKQAGLVVDGIAGNITNSSLKEATKDAMLCMFVHCSATREGQDLGGDWVKKLHMNKKGWSRPGYSDVIRLNGAIENLRSWDQDNKISDWEFSYGVKGSTLLNRNSRHFCYIGGVERDGRTPKDTRTEAQKKSMETYIKFNLLRNPNLIILGHNQVQRKACPSFDLPAYLREINVPEKNIADFYLYKQLS